MRNQTKLTEVNLLCVLVSDAHIRWVDHSLAEHSHAFDKRAGGGLQADAEEITRAEAVLVEKPIHRVDDVA